MSTMAVPSYAVWMIIIAPFVGALLTPLTGRSRLRDYVAVAFSLVSALFALYLLIPILQGETISVYNSLIPVSLPWIPELGINVGVLSDPYTVIIANLVAWISFLVMVYSLDYMKGDGGLTRYWFFMNFFIGSMQLIVLSDNLLSLFIGWEGVGLCSYALIGYYYRDEAENWVGTPGSKVLGEEQAYSPSHAGMKAFFMTRIGDVAMLAGILILFVYAGTFNYQQLASSSSWAVALSKNGLLVPAALLIFGGAIGKSAQFPLQEWLPDAMAGPAPVSALIHAATMVNAGVVLVARIGPIFYFVVASNPSLIQPFFLAVAWIGAFTAFLAATQALVGRELKKILAYSTASQIGYMMMALGLAGLYAGYFAQGLSAGLFQLISHAVFKAALFLMAGVLIHSAHSKYVTDMGGMRDRLKLTFALFLVAVASLSGIPPLSGFWSKDAVLALAWNSGQTGLFIVGSLTAGITAFYAFRLLGIAFFGQRSAHLAESEAAGHEIREPGPLSLAPYIVLASTTVVLGLLALFGLESSLASAANSYLGSLFTQGFTAGLTSPAPSFELIPALLTLAVVAVGVAAAAQLYVLRRSSAADLVGGSATLRGMQQFLENRWYLNAVYYRLFVDVPLKSA
ncbi:MAG: proton-conducting transporter membrane subunit, partial [Thaumarchaeota archaeon]|nr:proton-conducting transporter membrane subunit [Nitrososphaerota archaeon]